MCMERCCRVVSVDVEVAGELFLTIEPRWLGERHSRSSTHGVDGTISSLPFLPSRNVQGSRGSSLSFVKRSEATTVPGDTLVKDAAVAEGHAAR